MRLASPLSIRPGTWWRAVFLLAVVVAIDMVAAEATWQGAGGRFGRDQLPVAAGPAAAVVFYTSVEPFRTTRLERALSLYRDKKVDRLLFVGGFRPKRIGVGAEQLAQRARDVIGDASAAAADRGSYDTLSNLASVCPLRELAAPGRTLVFVSDALHLARIWEDRRELSCVSEAELGFASSRASAELLDRWWIANKDWAARAARTVVGEGLYRTLVRSWRFQQD